MSPHHCPPSPPFPSSHSRHLRQEPGGQRDEAPLQSLSSHWSLEACVPLEKAAKRKLGERSSRGPRGG